MALKEYQSKRNFRKTPEPLKARNKNSKSTNLMFVVQEHHASRLHWDFRLELGGVLKSWAVPKGPSLDPNVRRLAVEVEDHPLSYGHFEGVIPEKQYGAGEVYLWDSGTWQPEGDPRSALKKGHLEFRLKGQKLKGRWMLIRTHGDRKQTQWLLVKRSDDFAKSGDEAKEIGASGRWQKKRISKMPRFIEPQLAKLVAAPPDDEGWIHETKWDGYRMQVHIQNQKVRFLTRSGQDWTKNFSALSEPLSLLGNDLILDGEMVCLNEKGRSDFQQLQNALKKNTNQVIVFYAFDLLWKGDQDLRNLSQIKRKSILRALFKTNKSPMIRINDYIEGRGSKVFKAACKFNLEGIISKRKEAAYSSGRGDSWLKVKCQMQDEFVIGGYTKGEGARVGRIGALLLGRYEGKKLRYVGRVGTGFSEDTLNNLALSFRGIERTKSPFVINPPGERNLHWLKPELKAKVTFSNWTQDKLLRAAVFKGLYDETSSIKKKTKMLSSRGYTVALSNPERILFDEEGITKRDVSDYYHQVAHLMLPHIASRPLALVRCPEGISKSCFFHKHLSGTLSSSLMPIEIIEKGKKKEYFFVEDEQGLQSLVQMNAFEIHSWNCRIDDIEHPDQIVIDFDPGDNVSWIRVKNAAFELREILESLGLKGFPKLTGGKGVHVHIPILPLYNWEQVKNFSHALAVEMADQHPDLYTSNISKKSRINKIFIDYLRNGRSATAVSPYSLRARKISAVAMPLSWEELNEISDPAFFSLKKSLRYLRKRKEDPWKDLLRSQKKIKILTPQ